MDDTELVPGTVVPPFVVFGGKPGRIVGKLPESYQEQRMEHTSVYYRQFRRIDK